MNFFDPMRESHEHARYWVPRRGKMKSFKDIQSKKNSIISCQIKKSEIKVNCKAPRFF